MKLTSLVILALTLGALPASGAGTFYVDPASPSCSDTGPGTAEQPYCTIAAAVAARGGPGTTIQVRPGVYREQVSVTFSGSAESPFVIRATGPGPAIVDGADDFSRASDWTLVSGNVWLASRVTWSPNQVRVDQARLDTSSVAPALLPTGTFRYVAGSGLYVNAGGGNPGTRQTFVGRRPFGFRLISRAFVTIEGFTIRRADDKGINVTSCGDIVITRNTVSHCAKQGIAASSGWALTVASNTVFENGDHGIHFLTSVTASTIRDNESFGNVRPKVRAANGINLFSSWGNRLEGNRLHHNQDSGISLQAGANDNVHVQNLSWSNGDHGFDDLNSQRTWHVGDVAWGNFKDGFSVEGNSSSTRIFNCIATDNGLTTAEYDLYVEAGASVVQFDSDDNIFWNSNGQAPIHYNGVIYSTLPSFRLTAQDLRSIQADPRFVDPANGAFGLLPGSPAIDSGNSSVLHWPATDALGRARDDDPAAVNRGIGPIAYADRGALEFVAFDHLPVLTAPSTATVAENQSLSVTVSASDPDTQAIASLTADLSHLPAGNNARFTTASGNAQGTLTWTPTHADSGRYPVLFRASNTLSVERTTVVVVNNVDRAPIVTVPARVDGTIQVPLTVTVTVSDPDGDPITSLTADVGRITGSTFTVDATRTTGVLAWTPDSQARRNNRVTFTAANALSATEATQIRIANGSGGNVAGATEAEDGPVVKLALSGAYPNPAAAGVHFLLSLPAPAPVTWAIHDVQGRRITGATQDLDAGRTVLGWDVGAHAFRARSGIYLLTVQVGAERFIRRFAVLD